MEVFVGRQAILGVKQNTYGYELLYRSGNKNCYSSGVDGDEATLAVIRNILLVFGSDRICGGNKIFVNFTKNLLLQGVASLLPIPTSVVEILEDIEPTEDLIKALKQLRSQGYCLALDDFVLRGNEDNPFLELVDIIKVDFREADLREREAIARKFGGKVKLLAEKVETRESFSQAIEMGYSLFQGYFFCKPVIISRRDIPGYKINYLRILQELSAPTLNFKSLQEVISHDPALTLKLLKYINSSYFATKNKVASITRALEFLGENEIKRWASIAVVFEFGRDQPFELLRLSLLRARMCETIAGLLGFDNEKPSFFLMGLLSHMDVLLGRPMDEVLQEIPLGEAPRDALLGKSNKHKEVFELVVSYERAKWALVGQLTSRLGIEPEQISQVYWESAKWIDMAFI